MRRRTWISASIGLGALAGLAAAGRLQQHGRADGPPAAALRPAVVEGRAFGTQVRLLALHADEAAAQQALQAALDAVRRVDALMSLHRDDSQVSQLNRDRRLDAPHADLLQVLEQARTLSRLSDGAFDVTVQPLWLAYAAAQRQGRLPDAQELAAARTHVGWQRLQFDAEQARLGAPGMAITLNGLAQGHGADVALAVLRAHGIEHALLDTGEFGVIGDKDAGRPWVLGIRHPRDADRVAARLASDGRALATSGDYETTFSADFAHHHIFDPATGDSPPQLASATVLASSGLLADGLSTTFLVLGAERALALAARLPGVDALLIGKDGRTWQTAGLPLLPPAGRT